MPSNEFKLLPGSLPEPYCFTTFQALYNQMFSLGQVVSVNGSRFYNLGLSTPDPDKRGFPWFSTVDGNWYFWNIDVGLWTRPHPVPPSSQSRILWVGNATDLNSYDGGDANAPGDASGPMWSIDTDFDAKFPVGPGTTAAGTVIAAGDTGGLDQVTIPVSALPRHQQIVPICARNSDASNPGSGTVSTVQYGIGRDQSSGNVVDDSTGSYARSFPLTSESSSDPTPAVDPDPIDLLPPYRGIYFLKRSSRIWMVAP